jgi:competence protein ComEA
MTIRRLFPWFVGLALAVLTSAPTFAAEPPAVDLNSASVAELNEINGIGTSKAQAIVDYREKNGPFHTVDDLLNVKGIGDKLLARIRPQLTVSAAGKAPPPKSTKQ